ncbi:hypothetical protein U1Q18_027955, partial [Sarracenia purpurea var. burkii]
KEPTFANPDKESTFTTLDLRGDSELVCRYEAEELPSGVKDLAQGKDKGDDEGCVPVFSDLGERIFSSSESVCEKLEEDDEGKEEENSPDIQVSDLFLVLGDGNPGLKEKPEKRVPMSVATEESEVKSRVSDNRDGGDSVVDKK